MLAIIGCSSGDANFAQIVEDSTALAVRVVNVQKGKLFGYSWDFVTLVPNYSSAINAAYYMQ